jgi:hypothetical protein
LTNLHFGHGLKNNEVEELQKQEWCKENQSPDLADPVDIPGAGKQ